ncbi:peptidylprolyl isomerase [Candidatus Woesearchaeota archaeon]|nr:peptidylprolyl isomerase [Candidatus Woesearchaeota archaeon]
MTINKGDFIELNYTGRVQEDNALFDTTDEELAKKEGVHQPRMKYGPVVICIGEKQILPGIDAELQGKDIGQYHFVFPPEQAFGKKNPKLLRLVPTHAFRKEKIMPAPGMQVTVDNHMGIVKTVTGGRCIVDLNHPLAGKSVRYDVEVVRIVTDPRAKLDALIERIGLPAEIKLENEAATLSFPIEIPKEIRENLTKRITELISEIKVVEFAKKEMPHTHDDAHEEHDHAHEHHDHSHAHYGHDHTHNHEDKHTH